MVAHACNPNTQEAEAGGLPRIRGLAGLQGKTTKRKVESQDWGGN